MRLGRKLISREPFYRLWTALQFWKLELKHELMVILLLSLKFFSGCENVRKSAEGFDGFQSDLAAFCPLHPLILF